MRWMIPLLLCVLVPSSKGVVVEQASTIQTSYRGFLQSNGFNSDGMMGFPNSYQFGADSVPMKRNYFFFAIPALRVGESIVSARLSLVSPANGVKLEGLYPKTATLWDVSTSIGSIQFGYEDIGSGNQYGSFEVSSRDPFNGISVYNIDLNSQAIADINSAAGRLFAVGGSLNVNTSSVDRNVVFAGTGDSSVADGRTTLVVTIRREDNSAPVITLNGPNPQTVYRGTAFTDLGATVTDDFDAARTITGSGTVDTTTIGTYTLTYSAEDEVGNVATPGTRTVQVVLDPNGDEDNDGLNNIEEASLGTNPYLRDTDGDGVNDLREVGDGTDPLDPASFDPLNLGLVAYYPFNGDANDESGNGNNFTSLPSFSDDRSGAALGSATFATVAPISSIPVALQSSGYSFSLWFQVERTPAQGGERLLMHGSWNLGGTFSVAVWSDMRLAMTWRTQAGGDEISAPSPLAVGQWYQLTCVFGASQTSFYLNGKLLASRVSLPFADTFPIVCGGDSSHFFDSGKLDEVKLWTRPLSPQDVALVYANDLYFGFGLEGAATKSPFDPATASNWNAGGTAWTVDTSVTHDGVDSVKAQTTDGQSTYREYSVIGPAVVDFWWKVSSEELYDTFSWSVNGVNQQTISGEVDWTYRTLTLPAGTHTIRWTYTKDGSDAVGQDAGWLDDFVVYPATATLQVRDGSTVLDGEVAVDFGSADQGSAGLTKSLTFLNQGYVPIEAQLSLPQGSPFTFDSGAATFGLLIGRGESVDVPILLSGTSAGNKAGQLTISAPESATAPPSITLTGYVRGPEIGMAEGTTALTSGQTFDMGLAPRTVEFTIRNNGNVGDLVIAGIAATGNFQVTQQPATTIPPQTSTTFKVLAQSTATGAQAGSISITSNAGNSAEFSLALTSRSFAGIPEGITDGSWTTAGNGGAAVWNLVETTLPSGHAGVAAVTGTTPNNGESVLSMITSGPGVLSWSWRVSTQENFDWLLCEVDGREVAGISSKNGAWQEQAIHVAGGSIVRWVYRKDSTANAGEDRGYIANAAITRFTGTQTGYDFSAPPFAKAGKGLPAIFGWLGHFDAQSGPSAAVYGVGTAADQGRFHYPISKTAKGLVQLEFSKDLVNWSGRNVEQRVLSDDSQRVVIEAAVSNTSNGFFRLYPIAIPDTTSANFNSWRQSARSSLDSVYEINRIISGNLTSSFNLSFLKANVDHLKIVSARAEYIYYPFFQTREEFASIARAITEGEAYWKLHEGF
jgi:hypothetical protein